MDCNGGVVVVAVMVGAVVFFVLFIVTIVLDVGVGTVVVAVEIFRIVDAWVVMLSHIPNIPFSGLIPE